MTSVYGTNCLYKKIRYGDPESNCFDVSMYKPTSDFGWSFGHCSGSGNWLGSGTYTDKCCDLEGWQVLTCSTHSHGQRDWSRTVLIMLGHQFCDDFVDHIAFISLNVSQLIFLSSTLDQVPKIDETVYKDCTWLTPTTEDNVLQCNDGSYCNGMV